MSVLRNIRILSVAFAAWAAAAQPQPLPLPQAHAHNDYEHLRPLADALDHGFCSVEADIYLVDGKLLVGHDLDQVRADRTLETLYLRPLLERVRQNGGQVHRGFKSPFYLMIDLKSEAEQTYAALKQELRNYEAILTQFTAATIKTNAVTVILSGNRPTQTLRTEPSRLAAVDGRIPDLQTNPSTDLVPWISDNWRNHFSWRGEGVFPEKEREKLAKLVEQAHQQGRLIRFWAIPDTARGWQEVCRAKVDLINTDDLAGLASYLKNHAESGSGK